MAWPNQWPSHLLDASRQGLIDLHDEVDSLDSDTSPETDGALSRFLVVRSSGHIEFTFDEAFCVFAESKSSPAVSAFVRTQFFRGANPTPKRIGETLRKLDPAKADAFGQFIEADDQRLKRELEFMVNRRNKIAHGQSENVNRRKALNLALVALEVGDWVVSTLDPR